jgi:UDP-glucose 4-epimerase
MSSRRILITGLSSHWGGRVAQLLERDPDIEALIGVDTADPRHELQRTEFVRVSTDATLLRRIIRAARIDTVVDTRLVPDSLPRGPRDAHATNVVGTREVLAACGGSGSGVRKVIFKSSAHFYGSDPGAPAFFTEDMPFAPRPRTVIERDVAEAERALVDFARENPRSVVTVLRCADTVGPETRGAKVSLLSLPVVPAILGFDPRWQFIHEDDVLDALAHAVAHDLPGPYNAAGDGVLVLSEIVSLLGKPLLPLLPPWGTVFAASQLRRLGLRVPVEMLRDLRHGRGLDNRRLKATGFQFRYTTREAVLKLRAHQRLRPLLGSGSDSYRYEREVEEFLRWSPSVHGATAARAVMGRATDPDEAGEAEAQDDRSAADASAYADLIDAELLDIIPSLTADALRALRDHESLGESRPAVLEAIDHQLGLRPAFRADSARPRPAGPRD